MKNWTQLKIWTKLKLLSKLRFVKKLKNLLQSRVFMKVFVVTQMFPESGTPIQLVKDCFTRAQDAQAGFGVQKSGHRFQVIRTQFREIGHFLLIPPFFQLQFLVVR